MRSLLRKTSAPEGGFTVIELTVTIGILLIVMGAMLTVFESAQRTQAFAANRSETLDEMRLAMDQMAKDIRQATLIDPSSGPTKIEMDTYVLGVTQHVVYEASGETLTRSVGGAGATPIQRRLVTTSIFSYAPSVDDDGDGAIDEDRPDGIDDDADGKTDEDGTTGTQIVSITMQVQPRNAPDTVLELVSEIRLRNAA